MSFLEEESVRVLKGLQLRNGGILATLPNGAYPYVYTRDAVIVSKAFNKLGMTKKSEKFYYFMKKFSKLDQYGEVFQRYNSTGWPYVTRREENDNEGLVLHGIYDTYLKGGNKRFLCDMFDFAEEIVELIFSYSKSGLVYTKRSIHENKALEEGYDIWANCAACRGLKDASEIAMVLGYDDLSKKWLKKSESLLKNIRKKFFDEDKGFYWKNPKRKNVADISQLSPFYFELEDSKKILRSTMNYLRKKIWIKEIGGFRRFEKFRVCRDWHWYSGGSGSWLVFTLWGARFYRELGDIKGYRDCMNFVKKVAKKSGGLLPEHVALYEEYLEWLRGEVEFSNRIINEMKKSEDSIVKMSKKDVVYWSTPLGWSHAELILLG